MSTTRRLRTVPPRAVVGLAAAAMLLAACGGGDTDDTAIKKKPDPVGTEIDVTAGAVAVVSAGSPDIALADEVRDQIVDSVREYITVASVVPLRTGQPAGEFGELFTATATARAISVDRPVLTDEGLSPATKTVVARAAPIPLTVLADQRGDIVLITAGLDLGISTSTARGSVTIVRRGELTFAPDGEFWKIASFDLAVARDGPGIEDPPVAPSEEGSP
ncbi:MAG TPA: hypothetical protein VFF40_09235 [Acidimicrobiia bacterium]|nr:hypothetical protein [Acidimicrobiia bacterium]